MEIYQEFVLISILSLLLAFLIGKFFSSDDDADRQLDVEPTNICVGTQGNDSSHFRLTGDRCEGNNGFKEIEEIRSDDDDVIGRDICDLDEQQEKGKRDEFDDDLERRFEAIRAGICCASEMSYGKKSEFVEEKKIESTKGEAMLLSGASEVRVDKKEKFEMVGVEDMCKFKEDKFELEKEDLKVETAGNVDDEDDEWEGIERTELQRRFFEAATYVCSERGASALSSLSTEDQMQLYGLHKVATEGRCYDPQPMALKVTARGKWNAWQRLGNMNPDVAMEEYMSLLSEKIPGWMVEKPEGDVEPHARSEVLEAPSPGTPSPELCFKINSQLSTETKRGEECPSCIGTEIQSAVTGKITQVGGWKTACKKWLYSDRR